jgi:osmotically-inducible protein OsmY
MNMNKITLGILAAGFSLMVACKDKPKDADIQGKVIEALKNAPGVMADVKDGKVTLSGEVANDEAKASAETLVKTTAGVKEVVNNITVAPTVAEQSAIPAVTVAADDALTTGVAAAVKDFPGITATVKDGVVTVTGDITAIRWKKLKMALDALKPKKVDAAALKVN